MSSTESSSQYSQVQAKLHAAMALINSVEIYRGVLNDLFEDQDYGLRKVCVIRDFTLKLKDMKPEFADEISTIFHDFVFKNYPPLLAVTLLVN
jgi:hypothetical protein